MASAPLSPSRLCRPEEDPFLLLQSTFHAIQEILVRHRGQALRRSWLDQPYGEEEITLQKKTCSQPSRAAWPVSRSWMIGSWWRWSSWPAVMASWSADAQPSCGPGWGEALGGAAAPRDIFMRHTARSLWPHRAHRRNAAFPTSGVGLSLKDQVTCCHHSILLIPVQHGSVYLNSTLGKSTRVPSLLNESVILSR